MNNVSAKHRVTCSFSFQFADVESSKAPIRHGILSVIPSLKNVDKDVLATLDDLSADSANSPAQSPSGEPLNMIHLAIADGEMSGVEDIESFLISQKSKLSTLGVRTVNILIPKPKKEPSYFTFPQCDGYQEDKLRRDMRPTFHHLLELKRLNDNFDLERLPAIG